MTCKYSCERVLGLFTDALLLGDTDVGSRLDIILLVNRSVIYYRYTLV